MPGIDSLLRQAPELVAQWGHKQLSHAFTQELDRLRELLLAGKPAELTVESIKGAVAAKLELANEAGLKPVINLTGTVLHTNLGRASLPSEAVDAVVAAARFPSNLEFDLRTGKRGDVRAMLKHWFAS